MPLGQLATELIGENLALRHAPTPHERIAEDEQAMCRGRRRILILLPAEAAIVVYYQGVELRRLEARSEISLATVPGDLVSLVKAAHRIEIRRAVADQPQSEFGQHQPNKHRDDNRAVRNATIRRRRAPELGNEG